MSNILAYGGHSINLGVLVHVYLKMAEAVWNFFMSRIFALFSHTSSLPARLIGWGQIRRGVVYKPPSSEGAAS